LQIKLINLYYYQVLLSEI